MARPARTRSSCHPRAAASGDDRRPRELLGDRLEAGSVSDQPGGLRKPLRQGTCRTRERLAQVVHRHAAGAARQGQVDQAAHREPFASLRRARGLRLAISSHLDQPVKRRQRRVGGASGHQLAEEARIGGLPRGRGLDGQARVNHGCAGRGDRGCPGPDRGTRVFSQPGAQRAQHVRQRPFDHVEGLQAQRIVPPGVEDERGQRVEHPRALRALQVRAQQADRSRAHRGVSGVGLELLRAQFGAAAVGRGFEHLQDGRPGAGRRRPVEGDDEVRDGPHADHGEPGFGGLAGHGVVAAQTGEQALDLGRRRPAYRHGYSSARRRRFPKIQARPMLMM